MTSLRVPRTSLAATGLVVATALAAGACQRGEDAPAPPPTPSVRAPAPPAEPATLDAALAAADLRVEARRGTLAGYDAGLERHRARLEAHFGGAPPFPLAFQVVSRGPAGAAVLLQATRGESRPLVFALDGNGEVLYWKDQPLGGVKPGAFEATLASGPGGHLCISWCNEETSSVALRRWAEDGGAFADYEAFHYDDCDALSVLYWPKHGWLLSAANRAGALVQLITENGVHAFGADGMSLPWLSRAPAPLSFGLDTEDTFLLVRVGQSGGGDSPEFAFASRYDATGRALWPGPLSVKRLTAGPAAPEGAPPKLAARVTLHPGREGGLRATLGAGAAIEPMDLEILSDGTLRRR